VPAGLAVMVACTGCTAVEPGASDRATDDTERADTDSDTDSGVDTDTDCTRAAEPGCDEACLALDEVACLADETCRAWYGDRLHGTRACIERERFAACRHFDYDVDLGVANWTQIGPDEACWLFDPGQHHPTFRSGCSYEDDFVGVPDCD